MIVKRVITYGTFDLLHVGHIELLRRAKALGDYLIVACSTDKFNEGKGKKCVISYDDRKRMLEAVRYVDLVIPEEDWAQKVSDVKKYEVDIFVMGGDWEEKKFELNGRKMTFDEQLDGLCEVKYLPRTPEVSTTDIKKRIMEM